MGDFITGQTIQRISPNKQSGRWIKSRRGGDSERWFYDFEGTDWASSIASAGWATSLPFTFGCLFRLQNQDSRISNVITLRGNFLIRFNQGAAAGVRVGITGFGNWEPLPATKWTPTPNNPYSIVYEYDGTTSFLTMIDTLGVEPDRTDSLVTGNTNTALGIYGIGHNGSGAQTIDGVIADAFYSGTDRSVFYPIDDNSNVLVDREGWSDALLNNDSGTWFEGVKPI